MCSLHAPANKQDFHHKNDLFLPKVGENARCKRGVNCVRDGQKCLILQGKTAFVRGFPWQTNKILVMRRTSLFRSCVPGGVGPYQHHKAKPSESQSLCPGGGRETQNSAGADASVSCAVRLRRSFFRFSSPRIRCTARSSRHGRAAPRGCLPSRGCRARPRRTACRPCGP